MKRLVFLATLLFSLLALAANPITSLVKDLISVNSGKTGYIELLEKYKSSKKYEVIGDEYIRVLPQNHLNADILVAAFDPSKSSVAGKITRQFGFEILVGRKNSKLLESFEATLTAKYGNRTIVEKTLVAKADEGILAEVEKLGKRAEELASPVAGKYGLAERDLFRSLPRIHVNESDAGYETYQVFVVDPKVDAAALRDLLEVLAINLK